MIVDVARDSLLVERLVISALGDVVRGGDGTLNARQAHPRDYQCNKGKIVIIITISYYIFIIFKFYI